MFEQSKRPFLPEGGNEALALGWLRPFISTFPHHPSPITVHLHCTVHHPPQMLRPFIRSPIPLFCRSFAKAAATEIDDMEHGFAMELKKAKAVVGEMYSTPEMQTQPSPEFMEELTTAAMNYNQESQIEDHARNLDLEVRILLKKEAVEAIPTNFEGCRQSFDRFSSPLDRTPATETPPISGFKLFKEESK